MRKKIVNLALLFVVCISSAFLLSSCGKKYDLTLSYSSLPDHITKIYVEGYESGKSKYVKNKDIVVIAECEQGYEPKFTLTLGEKQVKEYSSYSCLNQDSAAPGEYKYAYKFVISTEGLTGAQTLNISTDVKTAVYDLKFQVEGTFNSSDSRFAGLEFTFSGLATDDVTLTATELVDMANKGKTLKYTYGEEFTCTIKANSRFDGTNFLVESAGVTSTRVDNEHITFIATVGAVIKFVPGDFNLRVDV